MMILGYLLGSVAVRKEVEVKLMMKKKKDEAL
jgi:hypothetical protein